MKMMPGNGQDRLAIQLRVVKAIEQVNAPGSGGGEADAQAPRVFGVTAGHEGGRFLVARLQKAHLVAVSAQGLHNAIDAVARKTENRSEEHTSELQSRFG